MADYELPPIVGSIRFDVAGAERSLDELKDRIKVDMDESAGGVKKLDDELDNNKKKIDDVGTSLKRTGGLFSKLGTIAGSLGLPLSTLFTRIGNKIDGEEKELSHLGGAWQKFSTVATVATGAALAGFSAYGIDLAMKIQASQAQIAGAGRVTRDVAAQITSAFDSFTGKTQASTEQIASAYAGVVGQLTATKGAALGVATAVAFMSAANTLADATFATLKKTAVALSGVLQAYGDTAKKAATYTNALYTAGQATHQSTTALAKMLQRLKTQLGVLAPSLTTSATLLVDLSKHGETGRQALSALQQGMQALLKPSKTAAAEIKTLGLQTVDAKGNFVGMRDVIDQLQPRIAGMTQAQQLAITTQIFGAASARKLLETIDAGTAGYDKAAKAIDNNNRLTNAARQANDSLKGQLEIAKSSIKDLAAAWGQDLIPYVKDAIGIFKTVADVIENNKAVALALAGVIGGVLAAAIATFAYNAARSMIASVGEMIGGLIDMLTYIGTTTAGFLGLGTAAEISGGEIAAGLAIATLGMAALVIGAIELLEHWRAVFKFIEKIAIDAWHDVRDAFDQFISNWKRSWDSVASDTLAVWHFIDNSVFHPFMNAFDLLRSSIDDAVNFIREHWQLIVGIMLGPITAVVALFIQFHDQIIGVFDDIWHGIVDIWDSMITGIKTAWGDVMKFFEGLWSDYIWPAIQNLLDDFFHFGTMIIHRLLDGIKSAWNDITGFFKSLGGFFGSLFGGGGGASVSITTTTSKAMLTAIATSLAGGGGTAGGVGYLPHARAATTSAAVTVTVHVPTYLTGSKVATAVSTKVRVNLLAGKGRQTYNLYGGQAGRLSPTGV